MVELQGGGGGGDSVNVSCLPSISVGAKSDMKHLPRIGTNYFLEYLRVSQTSFAFVQIAETFEDVCERSKMYVLM